MLKVLDHLEEWLIAFLMGAATLLIFVAVVHRYAAGWPIPGVQDALLKIDLSWAQELCIYMFVWMAKFGAAYGVRTGIHVGVDVMINRLPADTRKALRAVRPARGRAVHRHRRHAGRDVRLGHRAHRLGVARPRDAEVDRLPLHPARLVPDVLPLPAGRVGVLRAPASCRTTTSRTSRASTPSTSTRYNLADNLHPAARPNGGRP